MPPDKKLPDTVVADFETWIRQGAADPRDEVKSSRLQPVDWEAAKRHWAFQPIREPVVPTMDDAHWAQSAIDSFVLQKLRQHGMQPAQGGQASADSAGDF